MPESINLCKCGEIFRTFYCKKCSNFQQNLCRNCHANHFNEIARMKELSRLKRGLSN